MMNDLVIKSVMYLNKNFELEFGNIYIKDGLISAIQNDSNWNTKFEAKEIFEGDKNFLLPGIIDPHVHFALNLGDFNSLDDFYSGSVAAAYGGVTTFIDFLDPVSNAKDLETAFYKRLEEAKDSVIDYKFHATVMNPKGNVLEIVLKMEELGIKSVKLFTTYSDSNRRTYDQEIIEFLELSKEKDFIVLAHIENDEMILPSEDHDYSYLPIARSTESETSEALKLAEYNKRFGGTLYMVHLSSGKTLTALKMLYGDILNKSFFIESCPHYFTFDNSVLNFDDGYLYTMAPPLRSRKEVNELISNIDYVYTIGTDHCTFKKDFKNQKLLQGMPLGIGGVEHSFLVMNSLFNIQVIKKMTKNVAKIHNLFPKKGIIKVGSDADLFIMNREETLLNQNHSKCDYNLYENIKSYGKILSTMSRGKFIIKNGEFLGGNGKYIK